ncbi:spore germination protein A1 [Paraliobacillus ryukyuensis]|uniref:Spore germination protein KA n=1 Tax=Paraliobacillus ryukyuensis TaxID=200904 RepID=A0A366EEX4_9BACI|nr:spore germination protein [Paraliobacillus ryukyuensis]RBO99968.1 spore germination protein KA [Paraliobacillus ryukyuensis]
MIQSKKTRSKKTNSNKKTAINPNTKEQIESLKQLFSAEINKDFCHRTVFVNFNKKNAYLFYYSSIVNSDKIEQAIVRPLLEHDGETYENVLTNESFKIIDTLEQVIDHINSGKVVIFSEGEAVAYSLDVAQFQHRNVSPSANESVVRGPQEAFTESLHVNISLIRKQIRDKQLITTASTVGKRSKQDVTLIYIADLVNKEVLQDVEERLRDINTDNVRNVELLEQFLEERPYSIFPSIYYTERPDNAAAYIEDGHIVLLMDSSSACLILPVTFFTFFQSPEDRYSRFMFGNFSRIVRIIGFYLTTMISATYVALANYHSEMIPLDLMLAITSSRERVPFPLIIEVLIMEVAFELIREAGIRIPSALGPTIGIVGALILGQAAVEANIISPIIVIVSALSGLTSFAISDVSLNYTVRITRFMFIIAAGFMGMLTLMGALLLWIMYAASLKSFGVPYLSPVAPTFRSPKDTIFRKAIRNEHFRPGQLRPKDMRKK